MQGILNRHLSLNHIDFCFHYIVKIPFSGVEDALRENTSAVQCNGKTLRMKNRNGCMAE